MKKENIFDSVVQDEILENNTYRLRISTHCMGNAQYNELKWRQHHESKFPSSNER